MIGNLKANRIQKSDEYVKYIPIGADLESMLNELGFKDKKQSNERIIDPTGEFSSNTMMERITMAFTHYKNYLDPTILTNLDKAALEVKIFG